MQPDPTVLLSKAGIDLPLIGLYDAPDPAAFEPVIRPPENAHACVFAYYKKWLKGATLHITPDRAGCLGAAHWLCSVVAHSREAYIAFLAEGEGLSTPERMGKWLDAARPYKPEHPHLLIGPLKADQYQYLKSVTFIIGPDQLALMVYGAHYHSSPEEPEALLARFGSGCSQLVSLFDDLDYAQAMIGSTDVAMRRYIPADIVLFSVTKSKFEQLCSLDEKSFLYKSFWQDLRKARGLKTT